MIALWSAVTACAIITAALTSLVSMWVGPTPLDVAVCAIGIAGLMLLLNQIRRVRASLAMRRLDRSTANGPTKQTSGPHRPRAHVRMLAGLDRRGCGISMRKPGGL